MKITVLILGIVAFFTYLASMKRFKIAYKRGHGPGGQRKNKVETCVVVTDPDTGFQETCQDTSSRAQNEKLAIMRLSARIARHLEEVRALEENQKRTILRFNRVVRSYNAARNEVKDHRTGKKANMKKVLNGNLDLIK